LTILLARLEDLLCDIERLATGDARGAGERVGRVLRVDHDDLPSGFGAAIRHHLEGLHTRISRLARGLDLPAERESRARAVGALLVSAIVGLEDSGARGLRGYGPLDPTIYTVLDPMLDEMRTELVAVAAVLGAQMSTPSEGLP
jgi:hypothetical protein